GGPPTAGCLQTSQQRLHLLPQGRVDQRRVLAGVDFVVITHLTAVDHIAQQPPETAGGYGRPPRGCPLRVRQPFCRQPRRANSCTTGNKAWCSRYSAKIVRTCSASAAFTSRWVPRGSTS